MIRAIKAGQEAFHDDTFTYLDVSGAYDDFYPGPPDNNKRSWLNPAHADYARWAALGVSSGNAVRFGYTTVAGAAGAEIDPPMAHSWGTFPNEPWYFVFAEGDLDGNPSKNCQAASNSFSQEIFVQNDTN